MDREELVEALDKHKKWLENETKGEKLVFIGADLNNADLRGADLRYADLRGADLRYADLRGACLSDADLIGADLRGADLRGADLKGADSSDADLRYADLRGVYLKGVNLSDADLRMAKTQNVIEQKVISVQVDTSRKNNAISYWVDLDLWTTGCFQGTLGQLKESIEKTHKENAFLRERYYRVIDFILDEANQDKSEGLKADKEKEIEK